MFVQAGSIGRAPAPPEKNLHIRPRLKEEGNVTRKWMLMAVAAFAVGASQVRAGPITLVFQEGSPITRDGNTTGVIYAGTLDAEIVKSDGTPRPSSPTLIIDPSLSGSLMDWGWGMLQFSDIFGSGQHQIPAGSTIVSAALTVAGDGNNNSQSNSFFRVLDGPWTENITALDAPSGNGYPRNNVNAKSTATASTALAYKYQTYENGFGTGTFNGRGPALNVTPDVTAWAAAPSSNYGWTIQRADAGVNGGSVWSSENGAAEYRPRLSVTFIAIPEPANFALWGAGIIGIAARFLRKLRQ